MLSGFSGLLCLSSLLSGFQTGVAQSSARCKVVARASGESQSVTLAAEAVAEASAFVCGKGEATASASAIASVTATAFARAIAESTAECSSRGGGTFKGISSAKAEAFATAYAEAFAQGILNAEVCGKCKASAEVVASTVSELVVSAVAEAQVEVSGSGNSDVSAEAFSEAVAEAIVVAYAEALVDARAVNDGTASCGGDILVVAESGDKDDPDVADCFVNVQGTSISVSQDIVAKAAVKVKNYFCRKNFAVGKAVKAVAKAIAAAVAEITTDCFVKGKNSFACAIADVDVRAVASATATAIADAVVSSNVKQCGCDISASALLSATSSIVVEASAGAWQDVCGFSQDFNRKEYQEDIEIGFASALAAALVEVKDKGCSATIDAVVDTDSGKCGKCTRARCYFGPGRDVKPCCNPGEFCYIRRGKLGFCRRPNRVPRGWGGRVTCTAQ